MGLTPWRNAPRGKIVKSDVSAAKSYLALEEIDSLNRIFKDRLFESDFHRLLNEAEK